MKEIVLFLEGCPGESLGGILAGWPTGWKDDPGGSGRVRESPGGSEIVLGCPRNSFWCKNIVFLDVLTIF